MPAAVLAVAVDMGQPMGRAAGARPRLTCTAGVPGKPELFMASAEAFPGMASPADISESMDLDMPQAAGSGVTYTATVPLMPGAFTGVGQPPDILEYMDFVMVEACTGRPERSLIITRAMADFIIIITAFLLAE